MFRRHRRLITPETVRLSRPEQHKARPRTPLAGLVIESAEGLRFAYAATPLPGTEQEVQITDPQKVEGARMMAASVVAKTVELPLAPLPEPDSQ